MNEILPNLYLSGCYAAENIVHHDNPKQIGFVLTIMDDDLKPETLQGLREKSIGHLFIKKKDVKTENILEVLGKACDRLEEELQRVVSCSKYMPIDLGLSWFFLSFRKHDAIGAKQLATISFHHLRARTVY